MPNYAPTKMNSAQAHPEIPDGLTNGFCMYVNVDATGATPLVRNENGYPFVYETREEIEKEMAEDMIRRLEEFLAGERDFEDATYLEEYVVEVTLSPDGCITDEYGYSFGNEDPFNGRKAIFPPSPPN